MSSLAFKRAAVAWEALAERADRPAELMSADQHLQWVELVETLARVLPALQHEHLTELAHAPVEELGGTPARVLADRLRISRCEARRRIAEAADLAERRSMTGEVLPPKLEATAAGQQAGVIGGEHVKIIRGFLARLPHVVDEPTRVTAEHDLAEIAGGYRPDELQRYADHYELVLNPDGNFSDVDRARRRGVSIGAQGADGMSRLTGWLDPQLRAGLDAVLAKWAAPGMCNPADEHPTVDDVPSQEAIDRDPRSAAQRTHDALNTMVRSVLMSGKLGSHQGLPVTITATVKLEDLQAKAGMARTGGGTLLPVKDLIRMGAHAYNFLLLFDQANRCELYKGRSTRLATPAQRLVLYATERGCTHPGCDIPPYWCQAHHVTPWSNGGRTDIDNLTLSCGPDNRLADQDGWSTRKHHDGTTEWTPPAHLDKGQRRRNNLHHPERMADQDDDESD